MKRCVILLLLFMISAVSAAPLLKFQNEEIQQDETILATVTTVGEFTEQIEFSDITFYEGRKKVFFDYDILFYEGVHYLYIYASREGEFSIHINDIFYKDADGLNSITIIKPFNISTNVEFDQETNDTISEILSIRPGFIYIPKNDKIKLINKGTVPLNFEYGEEEIILEPLAIEEVQLNSTEKFSYFNISGYKDFSIPIINPILSADFESPFVKPDLRISPNFLVTELFTETEKEESIELSNFGNRNITDLKVTSDISFVKFGKLEDMESREIQNLTINFEAEEAGHIQGTINVSYIHSEEEYTLEIPVSLFILPEGTLEEESEEESEEEIKEDLEIWEDLEILEDTCESLNGIVCKKGTLCDGEQDFTSEGNLCCFGVCKAKETKETEKSNVGTIVAVVIILGLSGYVYYAYKKQKNLEKNKPEDKLKESSEKFAKRMSGNLQSTRVKGTLSKS